MPVLAWINLVVERAHVPFHRNSMTEFKFQVSLPLVIFNFKKKIILVIFQGKLQLKYVGNKNTELKFYFTFMHV